MSVDYVRGMTVKKFCKYGESGSVEHLLFLFVFKYFSHLLSLTFCPPM